MTTAIPAAELDARFSDPNVSATPWERVEHTIDGAELFWISTVRSDGRPHVTPLPAVWVNGSLYFCTGAESHAPNRRRHLAVNRSLQPVQNSRPEFAECRSMPPNDTVCHQRCCTEGWDRA